MALVPEIDEQVSRNNARDQLKQYRRISRMAGKPLVDIKSPSMDGMPKASAYDNGVEASLVNKFNARIELAEMERAMACLSYQQYWVLFYSYCTPEPLEINEVASRVGLANEDAVDYVKRGALMLFAEAFHHGRLLKFP